MEGGRGRRGESGGSGGRVGIGFACADRRGSPIQSSDAGSIPAHPIPRHQPQPHSSIATHAQPPRAPPTAPPAPSLARFAAAHLRPPPLSSPSLSSSPLPPMLQQAARQVRQQVARISAKNAAQSRNAATSLTLVRAPAAAPAAAFHSAAPLSVTASAQRDGHSSSSSPSGASAGSSLALLGALVGSVGGVWVMRSNEVAAESAAAGMPDVSASAVSAPSDASSPLDGPPRRKKKKGTKKRVGEGPRPWLPNAGKLSGFHSGITEITNVHTWQGFLFMWNSQAWPQMDTFPTKQCVVQIQGNIGGAHGNTGHLVFQTNLGQNHSLDAIVDTSGGLQGSYTLMAFDNKLSIKPSFQIHPNGNGGDLTVDWRAKEWSANFALSPMQGDLSLSVTHPLTYYLAMGTELHLTPFNAAPAHLNGGLKYKHGLDQFSVSKKDASYQASSENTTTTHTLFCTCSPPSSPLRVRAESLSPDDSNHNA